MYDFYKKRCTNPKVSEFRKQAERILKILTMDINFEGRPVTEISDSEGTIGFIYMIINKDTNEFYIYKKSATTQNTSTIKRI